LNDQGKDPSRIPALWYKKFRGELERKGFKFNPYDPCVANRTENGSQHTLLFHVDDLKSSHKDSKVNGQFEKGKVKIGMTEYVVSMQILRLH
jgi:hypothetical protein